MDLNAPLGMTPPPPRRRPVVLLFGGVLAAAAAGIVALVLARADPRGGQPYVVAEIPPPPPAPLARSMVLDPTPTGSVAAAVPSTDLPILPNASRGAQTGSLEAGVMVYRGSGTGVAPTVATTKPLVIDVSRAIDDPLGKARGAAGPGAKPKSAAPSPPAQPRVAIFVSGMGLDAGATRTAIETMPAAVTLAFVPYGTSVAASVGAAKAKGHEVLLQLPMRNERGASPGPHALRPDASTEVTKGDLAWLMDRFSGYDGVVNLLGAPVTADSGAMTAVLKSAGAHHLYYLDDGTSRQSVADSLAPDLNVEFAKTDLVLDATADPTVVRANLDQLVAIAKRKGRAIGMASGLPEHLGMISRFAAEVAGKGVVLVPVSALAHAGDPQQAADSR